MVMGEENVLNCGAGEGSMLGIIGGSGFYSMGRMRGKSVRTEYGKAHVYGGKVGGSEFLFVPRHGREHKVPPHMVNYRANVRALQKEGATALLTFHASGIISKYGPGDIVAVEDFIGFQSPATFWDSFAGGVRHADVSAPFDKGMGEVVREVASAHKIKIREGGIVATTRGPRFETKAEVRALGVLGANLVNMTLGYEAALANEAEIPLCSLAIGTNYACGVKKSPLSEKEVFKVMKGVEEKLKGLAVYAAKRVP